MLSASDRARAVSRAHPSARDGRRRRALLVAGSPSRGAFVVHWAADGSTIPAPGRFPPWRRFPLVLGPRRTRGPLSVACGAAEHAEVQPVTRMTVALGGANARHSAASQPCAAARCRTKVRMFGAKPRTDAERPIGAPGRCSTAHSSPILRRLLPQRPDQQPRPAERECEHHHPAEDAHHSGSTAPRPPGHGAKG
jgi:hypothetical protein